MTTPESPQPVADDDKSHVPPLTTRVVIAEDEALIRLDLEMLEEEGYAVVGEAGDGAKAVELAREHRPDLVILDVKMPILDGISAAERIAEESIAPVLMLTAFSQRDLVERARDAGAMAYLVKPFSKSDVVAGHRDGCVTVRGAEGAGDRGRGSCAAAGDAEAGGSGEEHSADGLRAVGFYCVPLDPEDVDGSSSVDAAACRGVDRGCRGEAAGVEERRVVG